MKNYILISTFIVALIGLSFSNHNMVINNNNGGLGDIKYSILPPQQFKKLNGNGWQVLDGRNINGSSLHNFLVAERMNAILKNGNTLPDARNHFIRIVGGSRKVGTLQDDTTRKPRNTTFKTTAVGSHSVKLSYRDDFFNTDNPNSTGASKRSGEESPTIGIKTTTGSAKKGQVNFDMDNRYFYYRNRSTSTQKIPNHSHQINAGGDAETRPKNIAFYAYIKISE